MLVIWFSLSAALPPLWRMNITRSASSRPLRTNLRRFETVIIMGWTWWGSTFWSWDPAMMLLMSTSVVLSTYLVKMSCYRLDIFIASWTLYLIVSKHVSMSFILQLCCHILALTLHTHTHNMSLFSPSEWNLSQLCRCRCKSSSVMCGRFNREICFWLEEGLTCLTAAHHFSDRGCVF